MTGIYCTYISQEKHTQLLKDVLPESTKEFQDKIRSFRRWQDAQSSLVGRLLLKCGSKQFGAQVDPNELRFNASQKPYFKHSPLAFNISHSGNLVVCAISDYCEIGLDIEHLRPIEISDFKPQMTSNEWSDVVDSKNTIKSFFDYWTQKEAVLKAHGSGMSTPLKSFENRNYKTHVNGADFFLKEINLDKDYVCHLAFNGRADPEILGPMLVDVVALA